MSPFTIILSLPALIILVRAAWFVIEFVRYLVTGDYETDKRLQDISR